MQFRLNNFTFYIYFFKFKYNFSPLSICNVPFNLINKINGNVTRDNIKRSPRVLPNSLQHKTHHGTIEKPVMKLRRT